MDDWLTLKRSSPLYRAYYPDGSQLDVHPDVDAMADEIAVVIGPKEAAGLPALRRFRDRAVPAGDGRLHRPQHRLPIQPAHPQPCEAGGGGRTSGAWRPRSSSTCPTRAPQRVFSFQAMYAGLSPQDALAIYAVIAYMDSVAGVYFPKVWTHALPHRDGSRCGEARRAVPLLPRPSPPSSTTAAAPWAVITSDGERIAATCGAQPRPASCRPRPAGHRAMVGATAAAPP